AAWRRARALIFAASREIRSDEPHESMMSWVSRARSRARFAIVEPASLSARFIILNTSLISSSMSAARRLGTFRASRGMRKANRIAHIDPVRASSVRGTGMVVEVAGTATTEKDWTAIGVMQMAKEFM